MRRWIQGSGIAVIAVLASLTACKQNEPPVVKAPPGVGAPTTEQSPATATATAPATQTQPAASELEPLPEKNPGILGPGPDGMTWLIYPTGIMTQDLKVGFAGQPALGVTVWVAYISTRPDTLKEVERITKDHAIQFRFGSKQAIRGLSLGMMGMKIGGKRRIFIPAKLAYGETGNPEKHIGPNQDLIYEVELLSITGNRVDLPHEQAATRAMDSLTAPTPLGPSLPPDTQPAK